MTTKFENLDKKIQDLTKNYYGSAVMLRDALVKFYELENVDAEEFSKACGMSEEQLSCVSMTRQKLYSSFYIARKSIIHCKSMLIDARANYMDKILRGDESNSIVLPFLFELVNDLNVQIPENVKQLVVDAVDAKEESEKIKYNIKLANIIEYAL